MADNDRPLPTPPRSRFGRPLPEDEGAAAPLTADRMAQAAAEGRLDEFLQHEIPGGEHARDLALMMLGMSGMMPMEPVAGTGRGGCATGGPHDDAAPPIPAAGESSQTTAAADVPHGVADAVREGNVAGLADLLRAEHAKRSGSGAADLMPSPFAPPAPAPPSPATVPSGAPAAGIDAALIDELIRIAADNQVTVDWLMLRAVKLYVEEYRRTGRL